MVDFKIGKLRIRTLEIVMLLVLTTLYLTAIFIKDGSWLYKIIADLSGWAQDFAEASTAVLLTAFIFATFGNTTVLIVFPYAFIVFELGKYYHQWWWLGLVSGAGAAVGEIVSYIIGRLVARSKSVKDTELGEKFHRMERKISKRPGLVPFSVFFFALTPLPDDMILVPMGMMKYPWWKSILPCFLGKTGLCMIFAVLGSLIGQNADFLNQLGQTEGYMWLEPILSILVPSEEINPALDLVQFSLVFIIIYFVIRIDFDKISIRRSLERRRMEAIIKEGGNYQIVELVKIFDIVNEEKFKSFLKEFIEKYKNILIKDELVHFDAIGESSESFTQSMEFANYIYQN